MPLLKHARNTCRKTPLAWHFGANKNAGQHLRIHVHLPSDRQKSTTSPSSNNVRQSRITKTDQRTEMEQSPLHQMAMAGGLAAGT